MSSSRLLLLLLASPALALACAARPALAPAPPTLTEGPSAVVFEPQLAAATQAPNPYAPTRSANLPRYAWQSPTHPKCAPDPSAPPTVLTFSGSVGVFPALPEEDLSALEAKPPEVAPDTWGSGEQPERRAATPDVVVAALRPAFRHCFSRWLDQKADAQGSVHFALELGCAGEVQAISADVQGVDEPTLECLFSVVAPAKFEPPPSGHATLQVPVVFKNAAR